VFIFFSRKPREDGLPKVRNPKCKRRGRNARKARKDSAEEARKERAEEARKERTLIACLRIFLSTGNQLRVGR
jgi:hypothetical protein